jgi:hypothetical protein
VNIKGWVLSRYDQGLEHPRPLVASMAVTWHGTMVPDVEDGYALVYVECGNGQYEFINSDEPDILWVGNEWDEPIPELLATYAARLDPRKTYANVGQVLSKLGQWSTRFLEGRS